MNEFLLRLIKNRKRNKMLKYEKVSISFNGKTIIDNFSFNFLENNIYVLMGESGCGKNNTSKSWMW